MQPRIMYIEFKGDGLKGPGRIGRVRYSDSGKSIYYRDLHLFRMKGYKANYSDEASGDDYWVSGPKRDGGDALYTGIIEIDDDVREEYWCEIRKLPERVDERSYKSPGKDYS